MGPHLAKVTRHSNGHASAGDWITDAILQFKALEVVAWPACVDVFSKGRAGIPGSFNRGEVPDDQIVLHNGQSKHSSHSSNGTTQES